MSPKLPPKILEIVFREIHGYRGYYPNHHLNDLHSCLLVNKEWCESTVPVLWSSVFYPIQTIRIDAITTYLSCLSSEKRQLLQRQAEVNIPLPKKYKKPKFEYASYLLELNFDKFLKTIFSWCKKYRKPYRIARRNELIIRSLLELFSSQGANIKYFAMNNVPNYLLYDDYFNDLKSIDFNFLAESHLRNCLSSVTELRLEWDALALDGFLPALEQTCRSLKIIHTDFAHNPASASLFINRQQARDLATLVSAQSNLQKFILQNHRYYTHFFIESLRTQKCSLKEIEFHSVDFLGCFPFQALTSCSFLTHISIEDCLNLNPDMVTPLFYASFPDLQHVHVYNNDPPCEELIEWADKKNSKREWWQIKLTIENIRRSIRYFIMFVIAYWYLIPFLNLIFRIGWKLSNWLLETL
ncbi:3326_t:CDS:2 [Funneliformis mosseae]|uniref:3326_t:CDS:1 n=1 Tax=Funneliformis mosseae TaxID=27381 RepID=A0A9N9F2R4_FUNMO|nr:3326_t:CDS:2 [Funneliformis mosseae]